MVSAIIVAAGQGLRMNEAVRKQYLHLAGRPVLGHTLLVFDRCDAIDAIYLVIPEDDFNFCGQTVVNPLKLQKKVNMVKGGAQRQESVYNGLIAVNEKDENGVVVIHDGVRPFVNTEQIEECVRGATNFGACIIGIPVFDTLKQVTRAGCIEKTIERDCMWLAQTPQAFQYTLIKKAHDHALREGYSGTDDASLVENYGKNVKIIKGSRNNIKITIKEDLLMAGVIMELWKTI